MNAPTTTVTILFMTPTTVYCVADRRLRQLNPAHEIATPITEEMRSAKSAALVVMLSVNEAAKSGAENSPAVVARWAVVGV